MAVFDHSLVLPYEQWTVAYTLYNWESSRLLVDSRNPPLIPWLKSVQAVVRFQVASIIRCTYPTSITVSKTIIWGTKMWNTWYYNSLWQYKLPAYWVSDVNSMAKLTVTGVFFFSDSIISPTFSIAKLPVITNIKSMPNTVVDVYTSHSGKCVSVDICRV